MGDHHHSHALFRQVFHQVEHLAHHLRVKGAGGLVEEHHIRIHGQGSDDGHALLLAAAKLGGIGFRLIREADAPEQGASLFIRLLLAHQLELDRGQGDVFVDGHMREEVELLEDHAHLLAQLVRIAFRIRQERILKPDLTLSRLLQEVEAAQKGALAAAAGADDHDLFTFFDG